MSTVAALALLSILAAGGASEVERFRTEAATILFEKGLARTEPGAFVCVDFEGKAPTEEMFARLRASRSREVGGPSECACTDSDSDSNVTCNRVGSSQPACSVSVSDLRFYSFENATGHLAFSCGWPRGGGEVARFEKHGDRWRYVGAQSLFAL